LDGGGNLVDSDDFCLGDDDDDACGGGGGGTGGSWDNDSNTDRDGTTEEECRGPFTTPIFDDEATVEAAISIIGGANDRRSIIVE
jgi:hypothetical protein